MKKALESLPVVVITGLRQAGKTTFLRSDPLFDGRRYLTLDDFATLEAAQREPEALLRGDSPLTIDEAQRSPELLIAVKAAVDRKRRPGQFLLSGSANLGLLKGVSESLAGRALYVTLHPFTRREIKGFQGKPFLTRFLARPFLPKVDVQPIRAMEVLKGGMPSVVLGQTKSRELWFLGYEQTYLERDVRDLSQIADLVSFRNLLRLAAFRTGQVLNQSELARDAKLPVSTASRYLDLLETSFVVGKLLPHLRTRSTRLIKSPKIFISDSGLAAHLTEVDDLRPAGNEILRGALFETYARQNVTAILEAHEPRARIGFWSVQGRHEVDFVISLGGKTVGVEVKAGSRFTNRDLSGLKALASHSDDFAAGILAYNGREAAKIGDKLYVLPLALLLS